MTRSRLARCLLVTVCIGAVAGCTTDEVVAVQGPGAPAPGVAAPSPTADPGGGSADRSVTAATDAVRAALQRLTDTEVVLRRAVPRTDLAQMTRVIDGDLGIVTERATEVLTANDGGFCSAAQQALAQGEQAFTAARDGQAALQQRSRTVTELRPRLASLRRGVLAALRRLDLAVAAHPVAEPAPAVQARTAVTADVQLVRQAGDTVVTATSSAGAVLRHGRLLLRASRAVKCGQSL